jgi:hypothetical protein
MKINNITKLLLSIILTLLLSACNSKSTQEETNTTTAQNPTTQTTEDASANGGAVAGETTATGSTAGGTATSANGGTATSNGGSSSSTGNTTDSSGSVASAGGTNDNVTIGEDNNTTTDDDTTVGSGVDNNTTTGAENDDNTTTGGSDDNTTADGNDDNTTGGADSNTSTDITPPVITLNGEVSVTLEQNANYTELGATALDAVDGNVSVSISGAVDTSTIGNYTVTYTAQDSAGNEANLTRSVEVINTTPTLSSITLESNTTTVNVGERVQLSVMGTYSDGSSNVVDENITYTITPNNSTEMNGSVLIAKKDANVTVQATVGGVNSNSLNLAITWIVNGHVLPPEPDKILNDSTLLGIDVNDNGVRDDVERWIYKEYKDKHPIHIDIGMQIGRGYKLILQTPEKAKKIHNEVDAGLHCELYYRYCVDDVNINEKRLISENQSIDNKFFRKKVYFNTRERVYIKYDTLLSGDSYTLPRCKKQKQFCDFNTSKYEE